MLLCGSNIYPVNGSDWHGCLRGHSYLRATRDRFKTEIKRLERLIYHIYRAENIDVA